MLSAVTEIVIDFLEDPTFTLTSRNLPFPSSDLCYQYTILESDHCPVISNTFRWFRSVVSYCDKENGPAKIREMIDIFCEFSGEMSLSLREYILVDGILNTCYRVQVEDSKLVCEILNIMYEYWSCFGSFHFAAILRPNHFLPIKRHNPKSSDFLTYFLEHARRNKLEYHGIRMIDVSVYSSFRKSAVFVAADVWCWKSVLRYLQYGARFEFVMLDTTRTRYGVNFALTDTFRNLFFHFCTRIVRPAITQDLTQPNQIEDFCKNLAPEVQDLCKTMLIMLRAVKRLRSGDLDFLDLLQTHGARRMRWIRPTEAMEHPTVDFMLPTLKKRLEQPDGLQHACRYVIRECLNENWQLPVGITCLPIPLRMKKYINLLSD